MQTSRGEVYNIKKKIMRSIEKMQMDARRRHKKIPKVYADMWGVRWDFNKTKWVLCDPNFPACCPMAAVLLHRQPYGNADNEWKAAAKALGISENNVCDIVDAFDLSPNPENVKINKWQALGIALNRKYLSKQ